MKLKFTKEQLDIIIGGSIDNFTEYINDYFSDEHLVEVMDIIEIHDKRYNESHETYSMLYWKSLPHPNGITYTTTNEDDNIFYHEAMIQFDNAIKDIEERRACFIKGSIV